MGLLSAPAASQAQSLPTPETTDPYYQIGNVETTMVEHHEVRRPLSNVTIENKMETISNDPVNGSGSGLGPGFGTGLGTVLAPPLGGGGASGALTIVDLAFRVWGIIQANKPVANIDSIAANALPNLAKEHWEQVTGWKPERWAEFETTITNGLGMNVIELKYQVRFIYGGSVRGKGLYIASAQVMPTSIKVLWGFTLNVAVAVSSIINVGTEENPVAQIGLDVTQQYASTFTNQTKVNRYIMNAAGMLKSGNTDAVYFRTNRKLLTEDDAPVTPVIY